MTEEKGDPSDWVKLKIDPAIFEEMGVRDPEEVKRENLIRQKVRQTRKELESDPDNLDKQIDLATLYIDGGNYEDAIKALKTVTSKDNKNARACKALGSAYALFKHEDEAIRELKRAAELDPNDAETHFNLGGVYMLKDLYNSAVTEFQRVIELTPDDPIAYANLAAACDVQGLF